MKNTVDLNMTQIQSLTALMEQKNYPEAYRYVRDIANQASIEADTDARQQELKTVAIWMDRAASINANDGSFSSEFVRGATQAMGAMNNNSVSDSRFQKASNELAESVIQKIIDSAGVPSAKSIIFEDVKFAVKELQLKEWGWAGTIGDILPTSIGGLGKDFINLPTTDARAMGEAYAKAIAANGYGMGRWITSQLPDPFSAATDLANLGGDYDQLGNFIGNLQANFYTAEVTRSPLILDLDGDGIETISKSARIHFDQDNNHFAETTGWVGKDDGLLVWDKNGNGLIDNGTELFGNNTLLNNGSKAANGFAALAELDSNHDNKIDTRDTAFTQLRLWKDADSDAVTSNGELLTLDAAGVGSIGLSFTTNSITDAQGNQHLQAGTYTKLDGTIRAVDDVWFAADTARTLELDKIAVSEDIAALPELTGFGSVRSLHQAIARDTSGRLKSLLASFISENSLDAKRAIMTTLIYSWAGVEGIDPASRAATLIYGNVIGDARKLATLEAFLGEAYLGTWCWGTRDPNPHGPAASILIKAFGELVDHYFLQMLEQTAFQDLYKSIGLDWDPANGKFKININEALNKLHADFAYNSKEGHSLMLYFGKNLHDKGGFNEEILAAFRKNGALTDSIFDRNLLGMGRKMLVGDSEANNLVADSIQNNMILGLGGNDVLISGSLNDTIIGGKGNDTLIGGAGNDTFLFTKNDGSDSVNDYDTTNGNNDVVQFVDVGSADITNLQRVSNDLVIKYGTADQLTINNYFSSTYYRIEQFTFADSVSWDDATIKARVMTLGTAGADNITGYDDGLNRINGFDGNDTIYGGSKDDQIDGGSGNDYLSGNAGNDMLTGGMGNDTIYGSAGNDTLLGGDGDDSLNGGDGDDLLDTGAGNDAMDGGIGNDTYLLRSGGTDRIFDSGGGFDVVQLTDVASTVIQSLKRLRDDLIFNYGTADQLTASNYFSNASYRIEQFSFADGVNWNDTAIKNQVITTGTAGADNITGYDDGTNRITGLDGNDTIYGGSKDDQIDGGSGNDYLSGNAANDMLTGGMGNDTLYGGAGNDTLLGGDGDDSLFGGDGDDSLDTGAGNDAMDGGIGNDTYLLRSGGTDRIFDSAGGFDVVQLTDVASTDITAVERRVNDLVLSYGTANQLTVSNYFSSASYGIEQFSFADGVSWDDATIKSRTITTGTSGNDYIYGYDEAPNIMAGLDGNDTLYGGAKDDRIDGGNGNDSLYGYAGNDILLAGLGNDSLYGGAGDDWLDGSAGNDWLNGDVGNDTVLAGDGDDTLYGGNGNDLLDAGTGNDVMDGGSGNDIFILRGAGMDRLIDSGGIDSVQLTDVTSTDITAVDRRLSDLVLSYGTANQLTVSNYFSSASYGIEQFSFADGVSWDDATIKSRTITTGTSGNDYIYGYDEAPNIMAGLDGNDTLYGGAKDDRIDGGNGNDSLYGYAGNDIIQGKAGTDSLMDTTGNNLFDGGADNDTLTGGAGNDLFIGGVGNDLINTGSGADMIAFNRGDGQDTIQASTGKDNTISIGKGIAYDDLLLSKSGSDLVLATGQNERITLKNWYVNSSYHSIANLQFVTEASRNYDPASTDPLLQQKIQQFNFENIVNRFDQARSANTGLSSWALTSTLLDAHLASSDLAGLGGDLTYGYGKNGNLSDISVLSAQALMGTSQFGLAAQNLQVANALPDLSPRLM